MCGDTISQQVSHGFDALFSLKSSLPLLSSIHLQLRALTFTTTFARLFSLNLMAGKSLVSLAPFRRAAVDGHYFPF